jgi:hypothetical protein
LKYYSLTFWFPLFILFSCKTEKDETFVIYHLKPNAVYKTPDSLIHNGGFSLRRNDFFVVKNYDINNETHKIKIDSFVVGYIKQNDFLARNHNSNWKLTFFKYGNGINENTEHIDGTDYAIHTLFSTEKEIASFYFDTRVGYASTLYDIHTKKEKKSSRKIVVNYFKNNNFFKSHQQNLVESKNISGEYELLKGYTLFLGDEKEEIVASNLIVEKLLDNDYGFFAAHKIKDRRPNERNGILRNYKGRYHQLAFCEYDMSKGISKKDFEKGITLHNQVIIRKKGNKLAMIQYGGNFRTYLLYKKLNSDTNYSIYLEDALDRSKLDYKKILVEYNKARSYDKRKLTIEYIRLNDSWASKHIHKDDGTSYEKTHYYQSPYQNGKYAKADADFFKLLE